MSRNGETRRPLEGGLVFTHIFGEKFTPALEILGRYSYSRIHDPLRQLPLDIFADSYGQLVMLEPRGNRYFASRAIMDAHLEWRTPKTGAVLTFDLFNVFGGNALTEINTTITDESTFDPTQEFAAARRRMAPRSLRIGLRVD